MSLTLAATNMILNVQTQSRRRPLRVSRARRLALHHVAPSLHHQNPRLHHDSPRLRAVMNESPTVSSRLPLSLARERESGGEGYVAATIPPPAPSHP